MKNTVTAEHLGTLPGFPRVDDVCFGCRGSLQVDISHHGSAEWIACGCGNGRHTREMTPYEKEVYTLDLLRTAGSHGWLPMETAPKDRVIWVRTNTYMDLPAFECICLWHKDAGFCVDELRHPVEWREVTTRV
jgi:hypothetical protein